jgi:hypothetical protein
LPSAEELTKIVAAKSKELAAERFPGKVLDFNDFFTANPELVKRGIGFQPDAFGDYKFSTPQTNNIVR